MTSSPRDAGQDLRARLRARWPAPAADGLAGRVLDAYAAPERGYHDLAHLAEVLDRLAELAAAGVGFDAGPVTWAAWFHDVVYDTAPDCEERSARLAEQELPGAGVPEEVVAETARLVRLTAAHRPAAGDTNGQALSDADLAILAAGPERYASYLAGVRHEYATVPDAEFAAGRARVLRDLLGDGGIFHTAPAREWWEEAARANLTRELSRWEGNGSDRAAGPPAAEAGGDEPPDELA